MKKSKFSSFFKILFFSCSAVLFFGACSSNHLSVQIPPQQTLTLDYPNYELFSANVKNNSFAQVDVAVISKQTAQQVRGFGLSPMGKATVMVEKENHLELTNATEKMIKLKILIQEENPRILEKKGDYITFQLANNSAQNIPLLIPTVMNPNLTPFSKSGVELKVGQEILFKYEGKKQLLLKVDEKIKEGDVIDVSKLLKAKKEQLKAKN